MLPEKDNTEALREALLNLDRLRSQERTARLQMEALVSGLHILNECESVQKMYREILDCLHRLLEFDSAAILVEEGDGKLSTAVCSDNRLRFKRIQTQGVFQRCLSGRATVLTDLSKIHYWPEQPTSLISANDDIRSDSNVLKSALLVALPSLAARMILVCASETLSQFKRNELKLLENFAPLATQAVRRAIEMEKLSYLVTTLDHHAHFDQLTGLPNRSCLEQKLDTLRQTQYSYTVMFLDLDNFKTINDTFGHAIGDILLSEVAFRMSALMGVDDSVARLGGDEFAIIIQSKQSAADIESLCEELLSAIRKPLHIRNGRLIPSASIGVVFNTDCSMTSQLQMQMADIAMYNAKKMGRNQYCFFNDEMKAKVQTEFMIETQLPLAIRQEQFRLVYQPIFTATTMECNKTEVLVRWGDGGSEEYCPDMFIPIAEKAGSMVELGRWITRQALDELSSWLQESPKNILSINVSQVQLQGKGFAADFIDLVSKAAVKNQQIELELSENIVATGIDINVAENINELRQSGFQFAFDDFGTGSSSLLHLQKFPGNCLKIDKSFINDIVTNSEQHRLVAGMIDFAHHLGMHVVAEGVETQQQIDSLIDLGSDYLQGFLLAKPCPADKVLAILDRCYGTPNDHARAAGF